MTSSTTTACSHDTMNRVIQDQLESLDDTDAYATAWQTALEGAMSNTDKNPRVKWGGRGQGGRGTARRTWQPKDVIILDTVELAHVGAGASKSSNLPNGGYLLEGASLKLLSGHVYGLIGRNGCGKSNLLRRMQSGKIPGWSPHISTMYFPQETIISHKVKDGNRSSDNSSDHSMTALDMALGYHARFQKHSKETIEHQIKSLEDELDALDIGGEGGGNDEDDDEDPADPEEQQEKMERICEEISKLEEQLEEGHDMKIVRQQAKDALAFFGITDPEQQVSEMSPGELKKTALSSALFCPTNMLLLDEPTNPLDVFGLLQLRQLIDHCQRQGTTVVLISHDLDLINQTVTDIIYFADRTLYYHPGNYADFIVVKEQQGLQALRQHVALEKKREHMMNTLENLKAQPTPKRGGAKKKAQAIASHKKKIEKVGLTKDEKGHRWKQQNAGTGIQKGSINSLDASTRKGQSTKELLRAAQGLTEKVPDKAVQFIFRDPPSAWGEPLITAMDVGHTYKSSPVISGKSQDGAEEKPGQEELFVISKKEGFVFDHIQLCVDERAKICILGDNGSGKSVLLRLLAKLELPTEGDVHHASGVEVGYFDQTEVDNILEETTDSKTTALSYLQKHFPQKTEHELRAELTSYGLSPAQATKTPLRFLSGGERSRLCLAKLMLPDPPVLFLDNPTSNLDVESVQAMVYGLRRWNGTLVVLSHDANFIRSLELQCYALVQPEGKLRRVEGGIDAYLKAFRG